MKKLKTYLVGFLFSAGVIPMVAQSVDIKTGDKADDKVTVTMGGRILFDGAAYIDDKTAFGNGFTISDSRLTLKAKYQKWDMKIDIGFNDKKINTKDIHLRYTFNNHSWLKLGYYGEQFGLEGWESSAWQKFMAPAGSNQAFATGRQLGLTYVNWNDHIYYSAGAFTDNDALSDSKEGNQGYAFISKVSYNPINNDGKLLHVGLSGEYRTGNRDGYKGEDSKSTKRFFKYDSNLDTKMDKKKPLNLQINDAKYQVRYVAELMASRGPVFFQGEYYHVNVKRQHGIASYQADGFYAQTGWSIIGDKTYKYDLTERRLKRPGDKTLEFVVRWNYTDLNDGHGNLIDNNGKQLNKGGRMSDVSAALNYYVNKYIGLKLNYSYVSLGRNCAVAPNENVHVIQGRILVTF